MTLDLAQRRGSHGGIRDARAIVHTGGIPPRRESPRRPFCSFPLVVGAVPVLVAVCLLLLAVGNGRFAAAEPPGAVAVQERLRGPRGAVGRGRPGPVARRCGAAGGHPAAGALRPEQRAELQRDLRRHAQVLEAQSAALKIVAKLVGPTVVYIEADVATEPKDALSHVHSEEVGSGVIVEVAGGLYVLTLRHVVHDAPPAAVQIYLADGRRLHPLKVLGDAESDVAVLPIDAPDLVASPIGDSDRMEIGDFVLAVGSPFGLRQSVTFGIISAKGRRDLRLEGAANVRLQDFLQTDAAINPGNSGGPLVDLRGEVIGINSSIASRSGRNEGIGFAIPINMFMHVGRQLIETGRVVRAFLGVNLNSTFGPAAAAEAGLPRPVGRR